MASPALSRRRPIEDHLEELEATHSVDGTNSNQASIQVATPPQSPRSTSPHPLEAHVQQLETYETERPPFYNKSSLAPELILSAESLRHDAKTLARILISFMAYAIKTHGTSNSCNIGQFGRFEIWPGRPQEATTMASTVLNEKNIVYSKAIRYARKDLQERGLYVKKFVVKEEKKKKAVVADWVIDLTPPNVSAQYPHHTSGYHSLTNNHGNIVLPSPNDLIRLHQEAHTNMGSSRPQSRANSMPSIANNFARDGRRQSTHGHAHHQQRKPRVANETNEFGYLGNNCQIM